MAERNPADSPAYWDYLQETTQTILGQTPWRHSTAGYDYRLDLVPEGATGDVMYALNEVRPPNGRQFGRLEYQVSTLDAAHHLTYHTDMQQLIVHQRVGRVIPPEPQDKYPLFTVEQDDQLHVLPSQLRDYQLLARALTHIRRYKES